MVGIILNRFCCIELSEKDLKYIHVNELLISRISFKLSYIYELNVKIVNSFLLDKTHRSTGTGSADVLRISRNPSYVSNSIFYFQVVS